MCYFQLEINLISQRYKNLLIRQLFLNLKPCQNSTVIKTDSSEDRDEKISVLPTAVEMDYKIKSSRSSRSSSSAISNHAV